MVSRLLKKVKKLKANCEPVYIKYLEEPIEEKLVLLEGGQGSNINGNMFSMLNELQTNPRWAEYTCVFTVTNAIFEKAAKRMALYGFNSVKLCVRGSREYLKYLATAKYIMTDNTFPPYFNKRDEQVFLNTWHGTPLKTLGKANKASLNSLANVQKNYLMSDYALFPNKFTENVFMRDYDLENIFSGNSIVTNYPRNYIFYDFEAGLKMKSKLGLDGKKVFAYMPTWRDAANEEEKKSQLSQTRKILCDFDKRLPEDAVLLVNLHFVLSSEIDCSDFKKVKYFPADYDTYEILNSCDGLITDYSSVFFDFAITRKKIILFAYDKEQYLSTRGTYMPFESLPFPVCETVDSVIAETENPADIPQAFLDEYCPNGWKNSCERIFELMVNGESDSIQVEKHCNNTKKLCLAYCGASEKEFLPNFKSFVEANPQYEYVALYRKNLTQSKKELLESVNGNISVMGLLNAFQFTFKELVCFSLCSLLGLKGTRTVERFLNRERRRNFYSINPDAVIDFSCDNAIISRLLCGLSGKKLCFEGVGSEKNFKAEIRNGFKLAAPVKSRSVCETDICDTVKMKNILPLYFNLGKKMYCISVFSLRTREKLSLKDAFTEVGDVRYTPKLFCSKKAAFKHRGIYGFGVPLKDVLKLPSKNKVLFGFEDSNGNTVKCDTVFLSFLKNRFLGLRGPIIKDADTDTVAIFRQERENILIIYVRSANVTDKIIHRIKQIVAFGCSLLWRSEKAKKIVLLYEKNSSKYEESASVLYEALIDRGYDNAYFIVTRDYPFFDRIPEKYRKNIIYKYSFKHYLYFFKSRSFIGTEAVAHSIDLKTFNILPLVKIADKRKNYVFLQHGVMYMVSLDSESRNMFKRKALKGKYRVVVSSKAEAEHFTTLGGHLPEDMYISGLPKFDRNTHNENADKIVIMPTWRPWEINIARGDFTQTPYFKMLMKIYESVPQKLKDKVIILPHPLIVSELSKLPERVSEKIVLNARYDDVLKDTAVLITDYSSIAYDAFYRGARVVFYWEEKDYCMSQYGPSTKLMLNEENVYGDFTYKQEELGELIERNYYNPQTEQHRERYSRLVNFLDGKNTERLIEFLKKDNII